MDQKELLINKIAQDRIDFDLGLHLLLEDDYDFKQLFTTLQYYIFNSIPEKSNYNSETYQKAVNSIPLRPTYTSVAILQKFSPKIAFNKLAVLPENENKKKITCLLWILKSPIPKEELQNVKMAVVIFGMRLTKASLL